MITFLSIHVQGFCSIGNLHLQLNQQGTTIIRAANGEGKSSIFSALVWCLYGKNIKGVSDVNTWKEIQPDDYKGTYTDVYFQRGEDIYKVIRCQKFKDYLEDGAKGNDRLILLKNAEMVDVKGKLNIQEEINKAIGMTYSLFMNSIMFGQGLKRLIQESNSDKKKLFEEIFNLEYLNIAKGIAIEGRTDLLSEINQIENKSKILQSQLEDNKATYRKLKSQEKNFKSDIIKQRKELKKERLSLTEDLMKKQKRISEEVDQSLPNKINRTKKEISKVQSKILDARYLSNKPLDEVVNDIIGLLERHKYNTAIDKLRSIRKAFIDIDKYRSDLDDLRERLLNLEQTRREYLGLKSECDYIAKEIATIDNKLNNLKIEKARVISPEYKKKIKDIRMRLRKVDEDYHNKDLELKDYDWLVSDPLSNNGIKSYLFDSSLEMLNNTLASYTETLGFKIEFNLDLSSTRKDFVTLIERDNHIIEYDELSGGEKTLVNLAMAFAMHEALTATKGINILFLDEVFDALSSDNIELVCSLIRKVSQGKTLFIISHLDSIPLGNSKILTVTKTNGISSYTI